MFIICLNTSAVTAGTPVSPVTEVDVLTAMEIVEQCKQPVAIGTAVLMIVMIPLKMMAMFALFTKAEKMFNPARLAVKGRQGKVASWSNRH